MNRSRFPAVLDADHHGRVLADNAAGAQLPDTSRSSACANFRRTRTPRRAASSNARRRRPTLVAAGEGRVRGADRSAGRTRRHRTERDDGRDGVFAPARKRRCDPAIASSSPTPITRRTSNRGSGSTVRRDGRADRRRRDRRSRRGRALRRARARAVPGRAALLLECDRTALRRRAPRARGKSVPARLVTVDGVQALPHVVAQRRPGDRPANVLRLQSLRAARRLLVR